MVHDIKVNFLNDVCTNMNTNKRLERMQGAPPKLKRALMSMNDPKWGPNKPDQVVDIAPTNVQIFSANEQAQTSINKWGWAWMNEWEDECEWGQGHGYMMDMSRWREGSKQRQTGRVNADKGGCNGNSSRNCSYSLYDFFCFFFLHLTTGN